MKPRHIQEMDAWAPPPRARIDLEAAATIRGVVIGLPFGAVLWTAILWWFW